MAGLVGRLVVGQSGGPTQVINNSLVGVIEEALAHDQVTGVYGMLRGIAGVLNESFVDLARESKGTLALLRRTPSAALGTVRYKLKPEDYARIVEILRIHNIRFFCYIGGNDSMDTAHRVHLAAREMGYELRTIGVPKTVDNDLAYTDHCPGYGSAARFVALAVRDSGRDTEAMGRSSPVKIVEVMGRNAGWLTAAAALGRQDPSDPPHLIYVPERPVNDQAVVEAVDRIVGERDHCVIALSEGAVPDTGLEEVDAFGHKMKGGASDYLAWVIQAQLGLKVRQDKPNYLQRSFSACMSHVDADEAYRVGCAAAQLAVEGESDIMITLNRQAGPAYLCSTGTAPLAMVANDERRLASEYIDKDSSDVTAAFVDYARPLIGTPLPPLGRLARYPVPRKGEPK
ncbi:MAG: 6-phosphofructokinase [Anaerolineae bacterium]|nr:6-phosphofructokinase [Anaerolineae bacterium]